MHEAAIAQSIVQTVLHEAENQCASRVDSVEIEIGELTFLGTEQVEFWVKTSFQDTIAEKAKIIFTCIRGRIHCDKCGKDSNLKIEEDPYYHTSLPAFNCPECHSTDIQIIQGKEAIIRKIKILKK